MKSLLITLGLLVSIAAHAAVPSYQAFKGTNGIIVRTNPPTGDVIIDGGAISLGSPSPLSETNFSTSSFRFTSNKVHSLAPKAAVEVWDSYDRFVPIGSGLAGTTSSGHQIRPAGDTNGMVISNGVFTIAAATNVAIYLSVSNTMDAVAIEKAYTKIGGKISFRNQGGSAGHADVLSILLSDTTLENGLSGNFLHVVISWLGITVQRNLGSIILQESWVLDPSATPGKVFDFEMNIVSNSLFVACGPHKFHALATDLPTYSIKPVVTWEVFGSTTNQFVGSWHYTYAGYADTSLLPYDGRNGFLESNALWRIKSPLPITVTNSSVAFMQLGDDYLTGADGFTVGVLGGDASIVFDNSVNAISPSSTPRVSLGTSAAPFNNVQATNFVAKRTVTVGGVTPARPGYIDAAGNLTNASGTANGQNVMLDTGALTAISNKVVVAAGTGGITVTPSGAGGVMTFTIDDDDAGGGGTPAGVTESMQFNSAGAFAAAQGLQFNSSTRTLVNSNGTSALFLALGNNSAVKVEAGSAGASSVMTTNATALQLGSSNTVHWVIRGPASAGNWVQGALNAGIAGMQIGSMLTADSTQVQINDISARHYRAQVYSNMTLHAARNNDGLITVTGTNQSWHINSGDTNMMLHFDTVVPGIEYTIFLTNGASSMVLSNDSAAAWKWRGQRADSNGPPVLTNGFFVIKVKNYGTYTNAWLDMAPGLDLKAGSGIAFATNAAGTELEISATATGGSTNDVVSAHGNLHVTNAISFGASQTYRAATSGGFFQLFNPVSSVAALTVAESTDAVIVGANGATPTVSFQAPTHVASNFYARTVTSTNQLDAGSITNRGNYGGAGTLFAHQVWVTNVANVKQYGAVGDGTTDDTLALSNALLNPIVYFPAGQYRTDPLTFTGRKLFGDGNVSSQIVSRSNIVGTVLINITASNAIVENLWFRGTNNAGGVPNFNQSSSPTAVIGVKFNSGFGEGSVNNCRFSDCFYGLWIVGNNSINPRNNSGLFADSVFTNCWAGITAETNNQAEFTQIRGNTFLRCYRAFYNLSAANILFTENMIRESGGAGIYAAPDTGYAIRGHSWYFNNAVIHATGINFQRAFNATVIGNALEGTITLASCTNVVIADNFWESSGSGIVLAGGQANEFRDNRLTPASITNMSGWDFYNCTFRGNKRSVNTKAGSEPIWDFSTVTLPTNTTTVFLDFAPWHPYRHIIIPASATNVSLWTTNLDLVTHPHTEKTIRVTFTTNTTAMSETRIQVTNLNVFPHRWTMLGEQTNGYPDLFKTNNLELELTFRAKTTNHVQSSAEYYR